MIKITDISEIGIGDTLVYRYPDDKPTTMRFVTVININREEVWCRSDEEIFTYFYCEIVGGLRLAGLRPEHSEIFNLSTTVEVMSSL